VLLLGILRPDVEQVDATQADVKVESIVSKLMESRNVLGMATLIGCKHSLVGNSSRFGQYIPSSFTGSSTTGGVISD